MVVLVENIVYVQYIYGLKYEQGYYNINFYKT